MLGVFCEHRVLAVADRKAVGHEHQMTRSGTGVFHRTLSPTFLGETPMLGRGVLASVNAMGFATGVTQKKLFND